MVLYVVKTKLELMVVAGTAKEAQALAAKNWRFDDLEPEDFEVTRAVRPCERWDRSCVPFGSTECDGDLLRQQSQEGDDDDSA